MQFSMHDLNRAVAQRERELIEWCEAEKRFLTMIVSVVGFAIGLVLGVMI